ncbi:MAG: hypothetical protein GQ527_09110, partial [Bacteroidales bacterium]|nr:hypothetical protein [Bacteroidales bacterium]
MTNQLRNKSFLFILGLLLFNSMTFAQQLKDSLSIIKHQADKNYNDSVTAAHQLIYEAQKHYQDSIEVCKKAQKLEAFFKQNPDSVFTVNLSNTGLKDFPPIHQYTKVKLL